MEMNFYNIDKVFENYLLNQVDVHKVRFIFKSYSKKNINKIESVLTSDGFKTKIESFFFTTKLIAEFEFSTKISFKDYQYILGKLSMLSSKYYVELMGSGAVD